MDNGSDGSEVIHLEPILENFIDSVFSGLNFCCPARIEGIQGIEELRVDVKPLHMPRGLDNTTYEMPTIYNVPLKSFSTDDGGLLVSPKQGQTVVLMFSQCDIDVFKSGSTEPYESLTRRYQDINDAVAIMGLTPFVRSPNKPVRHYTDHNIEDVTLFNNLGKARENKVVLHKDGSVTVNAQKKDIKLNANTVHTTKDLHVTGDLHVDGDVIIKGKSLWQFMNKHNHKYTDNGSPMDTLPPNPF